MHIRHRLTALVVLLLLCPGPAVAADIPSVWFGPAADSADYLKLFTEPSAWRRARTQVKALLFGPSAVRTPAGSQPSSLSDLTRVDAFGKLKRWGIATAIESPAVKEWDCTARQAEVFTERMIANVAAAGGTVEALSLDEPLVSGVGRTLPGCGLSVAQIAERVAAYASALHAAPAVAGQGKPPELFITEAYPSYSIGELEEWVAALRERGMHPAGLTLDVDLYAVEQSPQSRSRLAPDLRALQQFLRQAGIAFGLIVWSGHDPVRTDRDYYDFAMGWVRTLHAAIGRPDYVVFESWVTRCSRSGRCADPGYGCLASDPPDCGRKSVPRNLPEADPNAYTHTRLINEALAILRRD